MKYCVDCNKQINKKSIRCHRCETVNRYKIGVLNCKGSNNPNYKRGLPKCLDCGKLLTTYTAKRCSSCAHIYLYKNPFNHPQYGKSRSNIVKEKIKQTCIKNNINVTHGLSKLIYYCLDCGRRVSDYRCKRCSSCAKKEQFKDPKNHPFYIDGRSFIPYPRIFNSKLKEEIRKRDNYTCQNCGMTEEEHIIVYGRVLHVHHIDYNRENCIKTNLISLCQGCNLRANLNRDYWKEYYKNKIGVTIGKY